MTRAAEAFGAVCVALVAVAGGTRALLPSWAGDALAGRWQRLWRAGCAISPLLPTALLGLLLAGLALAFQATDALRTETSKDVVVPVMVGVLAAALYDRLIHLRDLYWQATDASLDRALNQRQLGEANQRRQFNRTRLDLCDGLASDRKAVLERILNGQLDAETLERSRHVRAAPGA